jgi:hypothetical protein
MRQEEILTSSTVDVVDPSPCGCSGFSLVFVGAQRRGGICLFLGPVFHGWSVGHVLFVGSCALVDLVYQCGSRQGVLVGVGGGVGGWQQYRVSAGRLFHSLHVGVGFHIRVSLACWGMLL